jgi:hypothetical protein
MTQYQWPRGEWRTDLAPARFEPGKTVSTFPIITTSRFTFQLYGRHRFGGWWIKMQPTARKRVDGRNRFLWIALGPVDLRWHP